MIKPLTKQQAAIVSAYTGFLVGKFSGMHEYVEKLMDRPVMTHELGSEEFAAEIKKAARPDYVALSGNKGKKQSAA